MDEFLRARGYERVSADVVKRCELTELDGIPATRPIGT